MINSTRFYPSGLALPPSTLSLADQAAFRFLYQLEGARTRPYFDTGGFATVGVGINVGGGNKLNIDLVLTAMGVAGNDPIRSEFDSLFSTPRYKWFKGVQLIDDATLQTQANLLYSKSIDPATRQPRAGATFELSPSVLEPLFGQKLQTYKDKWEQQTYGPLPSPLLGTQLQPLSYERTTLLSLAFNTVSGKSNLIGPGLYRAIVNGDRAEAWVQIRYYSNKPKNPPNIVEEHGLAKRRYVESTLFSLFETPGSPSLDEALRAYGVITRHRPKIQSYETKHGTNPDSVNPTEKRVDSPLELAQRDQGEPYRFFVGVPPVQALELELLPARDAVRTYVTAQYAELAGALAGLRAYDVLVGGSQGAANEVTWLDARGSDFRDAANLIIGSSRNDVLVGGGGVDVLMGGAGADAYVWRPGDGDDYIRDTSGRGSLAVLWGPNDRWRTSLSSFRANALGTEWTWIPSASDLLGGSPVLNAVLTRSDTLAWKLSITTQDGSGTLDLGAGSAALTGVGITLYPFASSGQQLGAGAALDRDEAHLVLTGRAGEPLVPVEAESAWIDGGVTSSSGGTSYHELAGDRELLTEADGVTYKLFRFVNAQIGATNIEQGSGVVPGQQDVLGGSTEADHIRGLGGNDAVAGHAGDDWVEGGDGADLINGGSGADLIYGDDGDDYLLGGAFSHRQGAPENRLGLPAALSGRDACC